MRILHTADWHVGKKLGRLDRSSETEAVLDELVAIAKDHSVDLVIVAGDLFDRGLPPFLSLRLVLDTLVRLADTGASVVAIPGNHDSPELFSVLKPHLAHSNVTLVPKCLSPEDGGVVTIPSRDGRSSAQVACFPFLHESTIIDWIDAPEDQMKAYADRVKKICDSYGSAMSSAELAILVAHFMIHGAVPTHSERELHIGEAYMAPAGAVPNVSYAALGHIHKAQVAPGSDDYARYCGSLMQLDFGDEGQDKGVVVAEVTPGGKRAIETIPVTAGRKLLSVRDTIEGLSRRVDELKGAILRVDVITDGPALGIADEVRALLGDDVLYVRADYPRSEARLGSREGLDLDELYAAYVAQRYETPPSEELMAAFRELREQVEAAL